VAKTFLTGQTALTRRLYLCAFTSCVEKVSRTSGPAFFCSAHWTLIPSDLRGLIERKFRSKRIAETQWSKPFTRFMGMAIRELKYIAVNCHQIPKPADFMFNDPPPPAAAPPGKDVSE